MDKFTLYLVRKGLRDSTIKRLTSQVRRILVATGQNLTKETFETYLLERKLAGRKGSFLNSEVDAIKTYGRFLGIQEFEDIETFPEDIPLKVTMSDEEIEKIFPLKPTRGGSIVERFNDQTLQLKILAYTAMRPSEMINLTVEDIDFGQKVFDLHKTKTNPRYVPIQDFLLEEVRVLAQKRGSGFLFRNRFGNKINENDLNELFKMRLKRLGLIRKGLTLYSLRHSFITRNVSEMDLFALQNIVGHKRANTTQQYVHLNTKHLKTAIKKDTLAKRQQNVMTRFLSYIEQIKTIGFEEDPGIIVSITKNETSFKLEMEIKDERV